MNLKVWCVVFYIVLLAACGSTPTAAVVPTALPTVAPTAVPVVLAELLAPLPAEAAEPFDTNSGFFAELPRPKDEAGQQFKGGFVAVFLYETTVDQALSYATLASGMGKGKDDRNLGEQAKVATFVTDARGKVSGDTLFQRCNAVVYIRGTGLKDVDTMLTYAHELDGRLKEAVC